MSTQLALDDAFDALPLDVYALGVVLYDLVFGVISWGSEEKIIMKVQEVPNEYLAFLNSMLAYEPHERPTLDQVV